MLNVRYTGFTLIEVLVVVMILAIIGAVTIPMMSSNDDAECQAGARALISDLELAQSAALARQASVALVFSDDCQSYKVVLADGQSLDDYGSLLALPHPLEPTKAYEVHLSADMQLPSLQVGAASFGGACYVVFNSFASPDSGGSVILTSGDATLTVSVESITGRVSVN
jgi:prepilin-type N-terminal cleavage/methylation domain-containing protein